MRTAAHGPRGHSSSAEVDWDPLYFFLIAVGYKVPWTAISSLLHQFNQQFQQPRVLLWLNMAYFLPSIPALLVHSSLQDALEAKLGVPRAAMARFIVGLGGLMMLCLALPACINSLPTLLAATAAVGVFYSIAFGTSHQLVPRFSQRCTVALTTGFVSCGVVVLLVDLALKPNSAHYTPKALSRLFEVAAAQTLVGLLSAALLLRRHWRRLQAAGVKQQQHQVIGVLPPGGVGILSRAGSGSSSSTGRQLLLPPSGWGGGHVAGAAGMRQLHHSHLQHAADSSAGGRPLGVSSSYVRGSDTHTQAYHHQQQQQQQQQHSHYQQAKSYGNISTGSSSTLSLQVTVSSDDGSDSATSSSHHHHHPLLTPQIPPSGRDLRWDPPKKRATASKGSRLLQRLQPVVVLLKLGLRIWPAWFAVLLSVGSSMLLFPLFTCVDTSGKLGERLPQVLFYARLGGDILGRLVPPSWQLRGSRSVLVAAFIKTKLLVILVPGILQPRLLGGDIALAVLVAVNWFMSGYINTGGYLLAPRLATLEEQGPCSNGCTGFWGIGRRRLKPASGRGQQHTAVGGGGGSGSGSDSGVLARIPAPALRSKAGAVMSFCFQTSCLLGLLGAWMVQELLHRSGHPAFGAADKAAAAAAAAATAAALAAELQGAAAGGHSGQQLLAAAASAPGTGMVLEAFRGAVNVTSVGGGLGKAAGDAISAAAAAAIAASAAVAAGGQPAA